VTRPNILILYTDQQRWDALGANGNPDIRTPHLDRLAREGWNFDHCFVQNPVCMPSRVSFLAGQYPGTLGITHMGVPVPPDTVTLPRLLRNYGYRSANIGKLHFLPHANRDHRDPHPDYGFDHLEISDEPGCYEDAYRAWVRRRAPDQLDHISVGLPPMTRTWQQAMRIADGIVHPEERDPGHPRAFAGRNDVTHTAFVAEQTMEWLRQQRAGPFLCIAGFYSPHSPWVAPQEFLDLYDPSRWGRLESLPKTATGQAEKPAPPSEAELRLARQGYYAMVSEVDHHVGRILECLEELGLSRNTVVLFTSDHGEWLGEHGRYGKGYPGPDCVSRVPLIIRWPRDADGGVGFPACPMPEEAGRRTLAEAETGQARKPAPLTGRIVRRIVEQVDVVPTLLEGAGIPIAGHLQGRSLFAADADASGGSALMEMGDWKSLRTPGFRYIAHADGRERLWDLERDPGEYRDVAAEPAYAPALAELRHALLRRLIERERPRARVWPY
jgi:arylsulfatase A-like enzyme